MMEIEKIGHWKEAASAVQGYVASLSALCATGGTVQERLAQLFFSSVESTL